MQKLLFIILVVLAGCSKKGEPEKKPDILSLRAMSDLATVEFTVTKVIKASDNKTWFKLGDRKILMSCEAHIKAGIDMSAINKNSFAIDGKSVLVNLPEPKIISVSLPAETIKTEYEEVGVFRDKFSASDRDELARQAEQQIRNSIPSLGILQQAKINTATFVTNFLKRVGFDNISIRFNGSRTVNEQP